MSTARDGTILATYSHLANRPLVSQVDVKSTTTVRLTTTKSDDALNRRTNNALVQTFTVAGTTTSSATNVTVAANGGAATAAIRFADATFARTNVTLVNGTNTFVAVAGDSLGRWDTNTVNVYLPTAVTFLYDQNGNLRTNTTRIFDYDDENQLTTITEPSAWKSEFTYDGKLKMRISRDYTWQGGAWVQTNEVRRVYDGMLVVQERDGLNVPRLTYTRGKDLSGSLEGAGGIGGLLALSDHKSLILDHSYFHADGNGNVTVIADTNQNVVARYLDDPFGNTLSATGPKAAGNLYRFSSKEQHPASGMVYYGYRWYMPERQRWLNRDPILERGGVNLYKFAANCAINRRDNFGLLAASCHICAQKKYKKAMEKVANDLDDCLDGCPKGTDDSEVCIANCKHLHDISAVEAAATFLRDALWCLAAGNWTPPQGWDDRTLP